MQVGQHRDAAEDRLAHHAQQLHAGQDEQGSAERPHAQRRDDSGEDHQPDDERQQAIAKLDDRVKALSLLRHRDVAAGSALRPGGTAQSRASEPHQPASHDDRDLSDDAGEEDATRNRPGGGAGHLPMVGVDRRRARRQHHGSNHRYGRASDA